MAGLVIQGFFLNGRPKVPVAQAKATRWLPVAQARGGGNVFQVDPGQLGLISGGGRPLPEAVRRTMETALGADFSAVRIHVGHQAERIGAVAFTLGTDIYFAPGQFQPDTFAGQQLLGHELAHVVQQRAGRVRHPTGAGVAVVQDRTLEAEADRLGHRAAAQRAVATATMAPGHVRRGGPPAIQRMEDEERDFRIPRAYRPRPLPTLWDFIREPLQEAERQAERRRRDRARQNRAVVSQNRWKVNRELKGLSQTTPDAAEIGTTLTDTNSLLISMNNIIPMATNLIANLDTLIGYIVVGPPGHFATDRQKATRIQTDCTAARAWANQAQASLGAPRLHITLIQIRTIQLKLHGYLNSCEVWLKDLQDINGRVGPLMGQHQAGLAVKHACPNLRLTAADVANYCGPVILWSPLQRTTVNTKLAGVPPACWRGWQSMGWPGTRPQPPGWPHLVLLPNVTITVNQASFGAGHVTLELGPEIIVDWLLGTPNHGLSYTELTQRVNNVICTQSHIYGMFNPTLIQQTNGNWKVQCKNYAFQLILNAPRNMIITYFTQ